MEASGTGAQRLKRAMSEMGSSVVTGITLTKFVGVLVLAWAPSALFRIYYFRMYMGIIVLGAFHGLLLLPVLLYFATPLLPSNFSPLLADAHPEVAPRRSSGDGQLYGAMTESLIKPQREEDGKKDYSDAYSDDGYEAPDKNLSVNQ